MMTMMRGFLYVIAALGVFLFAAVSFPQWDLWPHRYCLRGNGALVWMHVITNFLIMVPYVLIPLGLGSVALALRSDLPKAALAVLWWFAAFITACALTHGMEVITVWIPAYYAEQVILSICALLSLGATYFLLSVRVQPAFDELQRYLNWRRTMGGGR